MSSVVSPNVRKAFYEVAKEGLWRHIMDHKDWDFLIDAYLEGGNGVNCEVKISLDPTTALLARALLGLENDELKQKALHEVEHKWEETH